VGGERKSGSRKALLRKRTHPEQAMLYATGAAATPHSFVAILRVRNAPHILRYSRRDDATTGSKHWTASLGLHMRGDGLLLHPIGAVYGARALGAPRSATSYQIAAHEYCTYIISSCYPHESQRCVCHPTRRSRGAEKSYREFKLKGALRLKV